MISTDKKTDFDELSDKILEGIRKAVRKMAELAAANNENLIVGDKDGSFKSVPAKELLKTYSEKE